MERKNFCGTCGAKIVEYRHSLSKPLIIGLRKLNDNSPCNLRELHLTRNQWDNFQKLRYWDLVSKYYEGGKRSGGVWKITERGRLFLGGKISIDRSVYTFRGERTRYCGEEISIEDYGHYGQHEMRIDYVKNSITHEQKI